NIEDWSNSEWWSNQGRKGDDAPDINDEFKSLYGITYVRATKIFCDGDVFKKGPFLRRIKDFNPKYEKPSLAKFVLDGRKRLQEHRRFRPDRTEDIMDDQLEACMNESVRTADTYYSDSDNCMSF